MLRYINHNGKINYVYVHVFILYNFIGTLVCGAFCPTQKHHRVKAFAPSFCLKSIKKTIISQDIGEISPTTDC